MTEAELGADSTEVGFGLDLTLRVHGAHVAVHLVVRTPDPPVDQTVRDSEHMYICLCFAV